MEIEKIKLEDLEEYDSDYEEYILEEPEKTIVYKLKNKDIIIKIDQISDLTDFGRHLIDNWTIRKAYENDYGRFCEIMQVNIETKDFSRSKERYLPEIQRKWEEEENRRIKREKKIAERKEMLINKVKN